ncbi:MAG: hypothetical protein AB7E04_05100 [Desulfobacteraceae bacterium]
MKKIIFITVFILWSSFSSAEDNDFRTVKWGMSRVEVLAAEKLKPLKVADDYISYKFNLFGQEVFLLYEFVLNNLLSAKYVYENPEKENSDKIFDILNSKYEKIKESSGYAVFENKATYIEADYKNDYLKIYYKSKKIEELSLKNKKKINENEKQYLRSIF